MENEEGIIGFSFGVGFEFGVRGKLWHWREHFVNVKVNAPKALGLGLR